MISVAVYESDNVTLVMAPPVGNNLNQRTGVREELNHGPVKGHSRSSISIEPPPPSIIFIILCPRALLLQNVRVSEGVGQADRKSLFCYVNNQFRDNATTLSP